MYDIRFDGPANIQEGETLHLNGKVKFHPSIQLVKWQKYHNNKYIDINIHKPKYRGSTNDIANPMLEIHDFDIEDEVSYKLEVVTKGFKLQSSFMHVHRITMLRNSETTRITIPCMKMKETYFVGENITIKVDVNNPSNVLCAMWQRVMKDGNEFEAININLPKYKGTKNTPEEHVLCINDCDESDMDLGPYFLLAMCKDNKQIKSEHIHLNIAKEHLIASYSSNPKAKRIYQNSPGNDNEGSIYELKIMYHGCVEIKAAIRSNPKDLPIVWTKGSEKIDLENPKYRGSSSNCDHSVLCINKVTKEEEGLYRIEARNDFTGKQLCDKFNLFVIGDIPKVRLEISAQSQPVTIDHTLQLIAVIESIPPWTNAQWDKNEKTIQPDGQRIFQDSTNNNKIKLEIKQLVFEDNGDYCITVTNALGTATDKVHIKVGVNKLFISGPVVVSPEGYILFKTIYPQNFKISEAKWIKTKDNDSTEIDFSEDGYTMRNRGGNPQTQSVEIPSSKDNVVSYQLCYNNMKSNIIIVFLYDSEKYSTENEQNCLRFFALQGVSREAMKMTIDTLFQNFNTKWTLFKAYCKKENKTGILPTKTPTSSDDLDVSVMCALFQYFNKQIPTKGWDKDPGINDIEVADDVKRIRMHRNKISHGTSTEMTTWDFNDSVMDLIGAIQRLTGDDEKLMSQICAELSKIVCKGEDLDKMLKDLNEFRSTAQASERNLVEFEGNIPDKTIPHIVQNYEDISFHHWYPSSVVMFEKNTVAFRRWEGKNGACFMNRPLQRGEEIFLHRKNLASKILKFGLTNKDPETLNRSEEFADLSNTQYHERSWPPEEKCYACFSLTGNSSLMVSFDDSKQDQKEFSFENLSANNPLWLAFDMFEIGDVYQLSKSRTSTFQNISQTYLSFWPCPF